MEIPNLTATGKVIKELELAKIDNKELFEEVLKYMIWNPLPKDALENLRDGEHLTAYLAHPKLPEDLRIEISKAKELTIYLKSE